MKKEPDIDLINNNKNYKFNTVDNLDFEYSIIAKKSLPKIEVSSLESQKVSKDLKFNSDNKVNLDLEKKIFLEQIVEFSFINFLKNICRFKKKSIILYNYGLENLKRLMDIDNYLKFNLEMTIVKDVLFDDNQMITFDIISKMVNVKKFFNQSKDRHYDKNEFKEFFDSIDVLFKRQNETDKKLLALSLLNLESSQII